MKTSTTRFMLILAFAFFQLNLFATDHLVVHGGVGGTFATINEALAVAVDGDRVIVEPFVLPYVEDITITHSIDLLCSIESGYFRLIGDITIAPVSPGAEINIVGVECNDLIGNAPPTGQQGQVNFLGSNASTIAFDEPGYHLTLAGDTITQGVSMHDGIVTGCAITFGQSAGIFLYDDTNATGPTYIVGNTFTGSVNITSLSAIIVEDVMGFHIANNLVRMSGNFSISSFHKYSMIRLNDSTGTTSYGGIIENNTMLAATNFSLLSNGRILDFTTLTQEIIMQNNYRTFGLPYDYGAAGLELMTDRFNILESSGGVNLATGQLSPASSGIDAGYPLPEYTDLDLTRNDAGCYGGSWSKENFDGVPPGAMTSILFAPRRIMQGDSFDIKATGFDR